MISGFHINQWWLIFIRASLHSAEDTFSYASLNVSITEMGLNMFYGVYVYVYKYHIIYIYMITSIYLKNQWIPAVMHLFPTSDSYISKLSRLYADRKTLLCWPCNIPGGMLWDGSGCHHVCAWECVRWMLLYLFQLLSQVLLWLLAGYCCAQVTQFYTLI